MKCNNNLSPVSNLTSLIFDLSALLRLNTNIKGRKNSQWSSTTAADRTKRALSSSQNTPWIWQLTMNTQRLLQGSGAADWNLRVWELKHHKLTVKHFLSALGWQKKNHIYNSKYIYDMAVIWGVGHLYCFRSTLINCLFPSILGHELYLIYKAELNLKCLMPQWWPGEFPSQ